MWRIVRIGLALFLTTVAVVAVSGSPASAKPVNKYLSRYVNSNGSWTRGKATYITLKKGFIDFRITNLTSGGTCLRVRDAQNGRIWGQACFDDYEAKSLARDIPAGTRFRVDAFKRWPGGSDNRFQGYLTYQR